VIQISVIQGLDEYHFHSLHQSFLMTSHLSGQSSLMGIDGPQSVSDGVSEAMNYNVITEVGLHPLVQGIGG
jgi:hypothetical protein